MDRLSLPVGAERGPRGIDQDEHTEVVGQFAALGVSDAVVLGSELDNIDLYRPIVEMYVSAITLP